MTTKLVYKTLEAILVIALKAKEDPKCKFTSLVHLLTEDFLKEEDVLLKSRMREIFTSGSVRGLIITLGLLP